MKDLFVVKKINNFIDENVIKGLMEENNITEFDASKINMSLALPFAMNSAEIIGVCTTLSKAKSIVRKNFPNFNIEFITEGDVTSSDGMDIGIDEDDEVKDVLAITYEIIRIKPDKELDDLSKYLINGENFIDNCDVVDTLMSANVIDDMDIDDEIKNAIKNSKTSSKNIAGLNFNNFIKDKEDE